MRAIIQTGGKQYRVAVGDTIEVEKLESAAGVSVKFPVLMIEAEQPQDSKVGRPLLDGVEVTGEVVEQTKGPKLIAYTYRRRKGSERKVGHRQPLTIVKITDIKG
jgi:large subunit ribosomal protein L21